MPLSEDDAREVVQDLLKVRDDELKRLNKIREYMRGKASRIYSPRRTTAEYRQIVDMSNVNILPLIVSAFAQNLFAEGYRGKRAKDNKDAWERWQDNRMDQRQSLIYRAALTYGLSYATCLKKKGGGALITPYSPCELTAVYDDPVNDEWPVYAITCSDGYDAASRKRVLRIDLLDGAEGDGWKYRFVKDSNGALIYDPDESGAHGMPVTPVVRWVNVGQDLDGAPVSEVEPLFSEQDQLNQTTYGLLIAQQFAAFRQRWVTGMTIEEDADGNDRAPFNGGVDRILQAESPDTKFGEFGETSLSGYLESRQSTLSIIAVLAQISPNALILANGSVANLSAEALAALESSQQRKQSGMKTSFGESNEQLLRLASAADGDKDGWEDRSSQIVWRDTESRSLAQAADAINKLAALDIPPRALWDLLLDWLPNLSQQDLERWEQYANLEDKKAAEQPGVPPPPDPEQLIQQGAPGVNGRRPVSAGAPA